MQPKFSSQFSLFLKTENAANYPVGIKVEISYLWASIKDSCMCGDVGHHLLILAAPSFQKILKFKNKEGDKKAL